MCIRDRLVGSDIKRLVHLLFLSPVIDPYADRNSWQLDQTSKEEIEVEISTNGRCAKENAIVHQCIDEP